MPAYGIERIGAAVANATTITIPAGHQVGDLIVIFAFRDGSATNPTIPAGWTSITNTTDGTSCSVSAGWKIAASAAETSGTWTNASGLAVAVYRGMRIPSSIAGNPIGTFAASAGTTNTVTYAALSTFKAPTSWLVAFAGHRSTNVTLETAPTGLTNIANGAGATCEMSVHDSAGPYRAADSWPATTVSLTGTASGWQTMMIEIRAPGILPPLYRGVSSNGLSVSPGRVR